MKRVFILLLVSILNAAMFGQRKDEASLSLEEIKDMPQKIIKAYFKPVYTSTGVSYPLMQWYASENKIDIWDKNALNKFNSSIYGFKENPIKAAATVVFPVPPLPLNIRSDFIIYSPPLRYFLKYQKIF